MLTIKIVKCEDCPMSDADCEWCEYGNLHIIHEGTIQPDCPLLENGGLILQPGLEKF